MTFEHIKKQLISPSYFGKNLLMMYGADISIPKKARVGQLVPPAGDEDCDGIIPFAACVQATDVVLVETLIPSSLKSLLYSQLKNL